MLATADCGFHLNGAAFAMRDSRHHSNSRVLIYGMYNMNSRIAILSAGERTGPIRSKIARYERDGED